MFLINGAKRDLVPRELSMVIETDFKKDLKKVLQKGMRVDFRRDLMLERVDSP